MSNAADYVHLRQRVFCEPLLIERGKLEVILHVLSERIGGFASPLGDSPQAAGLERAQADELSAARKTTTADGIRVLGVRDTLVRRASGMRAMSGMTGYELLTQDLREALADPSVRGILLDVDSPGGEAQGSFDLAAELLAARDRKPIFAVANQNAFSAAYLLAAQASRVYVSQTSGVGSVGVYMAHVDQSRANEQAGIRPTFISAGKRKLDGNPHEALPEDVRERLQARVNKTHDLFVAAVAKARGLSESAVRETEADTYYGEDAIERGLATHFGTLETALEDLRQEIATMDELERLQTENGQLAEKIETLQGALAERTATIEELRQAIARHDDERRMGLVNALDARCTAANAMPLTADERASVLKALALDADLGKQLGEALVDRRLAGMAAAPQGGQRDLGLDAESEDAKELLNLEVAKLRSQGFSVTLNEKGTEILEAVKA